MGFHKVFRFLAGNPDLTTSWLAYFLGTHVKGQQVEAQDFPHINFGHHGYIGPNPEATYLVSRFSMMHAHADEEEQKEILAVARCVIEGVSLILAETLNDERNTLKADKGILQMHNIWLLDNLLFLIGGLPCSERVRRELLTITIQMHKDKRYKEWKTTNIDVYNQLISAISNLIDEEENIGAWRDRLASDLRDLDYAVSAFCVLFRIDPVDTLENNLCSVIGVLNTEGLSVSNLMFWLAYEASNKIELGEVIIRVLSGGSQGKAVQEFYKSKGAINKETGGAG